MGGGVVGVCWWYRVSKAMVRVWAFLDDLGNHGRLWNRGRI